MKKIIATSLFFVFGFVFSAWGFSPLNYAYYPTIGPSISPVNIKVVISHFTVINNSLQAVFKIVKETETSIKTQGMNHLYQPEKSQEKVDGSPGQGKYTFCKKPLDKVKEKEIAKKFRRIFTKVKNQRRVNTESRIAARKKFIRDNLLAMKVAVEQIEKDLAIYNDKISESRRCNVDGAGSDCKYSIQDGGNNEILYAYGQSLKTLDEIVRLWENVVALKARLVSLQTLERIKFQNETEADSESDETSTISFNFAPIKGKGSYDQTTEKAFASAVKKIDFSAIGNVSIFSRAEDTSKKNPITESRDKILAINEMNEVTQYVENAMQVHNLLNSMPQYREKALEVEKEEKRYKKVLQALIDADKCGIRYMSRFFNNPEVAWSGVNLGANAGNHELRKGISGWAYDAYSVAKAAQASSVSTDDIVGTSFSDDEIDEYEDDPAASKSSKKAETMDDSMGASKEDKAAREARLSALLAWEIGAKASQMIYHEPEKWGSFNNNRPVWEDSKRLYESYIDQKYDNIKFYLKRYTKLDTLKLIYAVVSGGSYSLYEAANQIQIMNSLKDIGDALLAELNGQIATKENIISTNALKLKQLSDSKESKLKKIDEITEKLKTNSQKIEEIRSIGKNKTFSTMTKLMTGPVTFPKNGEEVKDVAISFVSQKESGEIIKKENSENINKDEIKKLDEENKNLKDERKDLEKDIKSIDRQIAKAIDDAQKYKMAYSNNLEAKLKSIDDLKDSLTLRGINAVGNQITTLIEEIKEKEDIVVEGCMSAGEYIIGELNTKIDNLVNNAKKQILSKGNKLYTAEGYNEAVSIHNEMLSAIKNLRIDVKKERKDEQTTVEETGANGTKTSKTVTVKKMYVTASLSDRAGALVYGDLKDAGGVETEGLFVGAAPRKRDFNAPYSSAAFGYPHVREVVHFDADNFVNTKPLVDGKIVSAEILADDFLKFGGEVPLVWEHMLKDKTFIERRYDLSKALSLGCENEVMARGGIFPCVVEGSTYVLDRNYQSEKYILSEENATKLPKCKQLILKDGKIVHTTFNSKIKTKSENLNYDAECTFSELGMFLDADTNNNLTYKSYALEKVFNVLTEEDDDSEFNDSAKDMYAVANYALLNKNIVGSFLEYTEYEKQAKEALDKIRNDYEELKTELYEQFAALGFTPSEEFNLAKEEDYEAAIKNLKKIKKTHMQEASARISAVDKQDNKMTSEAGEKMQRLLSYLKKDDDAIMQISLSDRDNLDFDEEFQKKKTDNAVVDKYEKSLKEKQKEHNEDLIPYCANF